jgi:hypothetical protein
VDSLVFSVFHCFSLQTYCTLVAANLFKLRVPLIPVAVVPNGLDVEILFPNRTTPEPVLYIAICPVGRPVKDIILLSDTNEPVESICMALAPSMFRLVPDEEYTKALLPSEIVVDDS